MARANRLSQTDQPPRTRTAGETPGSPMWWLRRLHQGIIARHPSITRLQTYYDGEFSLRYADERLRQVFGRVFYADRFGINFCRLVCGAVEERLRIDGIRVDGSEKNDPAAWDIWQAANLDETSSTAHIEALINGVSYVTVWPSDDPQHPDITVEHPAQAIVEVNPKRPRERLAGLRMYVDAYGYLHAELFMPDNVYLYKSQAARDTQWDPSRMAWVYDTAIPSVDGAIENPYGMVPLVPFNNLPRLALNTLTVARAVAKRSEMWACMPVQDAINSVLFNLLLTGNAQGYRQRWATGLDIEVDDQGNAKEPFRAGIDRLWQAQSPDTKFGEFSAADMSQFILTMDMLVHALGAVAQVPPHYFSASADRLSGESIKAAESGLIAKVKRRQVTYGGAWEEVMRLAGKMTDNASLSQARAAEIVWGNPEVRSDAEIADAAVKRQTVGVPWQAIMEFLGATPTQIEQWSRMREADAKLTAPPQMPVPGTWSAAEPVTGAAPEPSTTSNGNSSEGMAGMSSGMQGQPVAGVKR